MSLQPPRPIDDVIGNAIGTTGRASGSSSARRVVQKRPPSDFGADENEIQRIKRLVKRSYKRDFEKTNTTDRIINAIEYLTVNYPNVLLPMVLLYWMCMPGADFPSATHNDVLMFSKRVSRCKMTMLMRYGRSFFRVGNTKTHSGYFRGYVNKEELAKYEAPKAGRNLVKAHVKAQTLSAAIGKVESLKVGADFTKQQKDAAKDYAKLVETIGQSIKGYLPAPPPKPTSKTEPGE